MNKSRLLLLLLAMGSLAGTVPAAATSDLWYRYPATAGIGPCGGKIIEQVIEGGSVTFSYAKVVVACMGSPTQASWVLISGADCGEPVNTKAGRCNGNSRVGAMGRIRALAEYAESNKSSIRLAAAVVGLNCKTVPSQRDASWSCQSYEDLAGMDLTVAARPFVNAQGNFNVPLFGNTVELPLNFDRKLVKPPQVQPVAAATGNAPVAQPSRSTTQWRGGSERIAFSDPESDAIVAVECTSPGKVELFVGDPTERSKGLKGREGTIAALGWSERASFVVKPGDGDGLVFSIDPNSIALDSLVSERDFTIRIPTGETVIVEARGAGRLATKLKEACKLAPRPSAFLRALPVAIERNENIGWWVVLATGPGTPDRQTNGGAEVDAKAARCGIRTFNDFSSKFVGFKPGYNAFVLLGSPYGDKAMADANLRLVEGCFPGAYVKQARYLGE